MRRRRLLLAAPRWRHCRGLPRRSRARSARIGWLTAQRPASLVPYVQAFRSSLAELGFAEGKNLTIEFRYGDDDLSKVRRPGRGAGAPAGRLDRRPGRGGARDQDAKLPVPVVYAYSGDPVAAGLAESLARPNASMTGLTYLGLELNGKRLELLREIVPSVRRVALLSNPAYPGESGERANSEAAAGRIGLDVRYVAARTSDELEAAFTRMTSEKVQAISLFADSFAVQNRGRIIAFAMSQRIPLVSSWPVFAESGALCTYGPRLADSYRRLAYYADRVLRGTRPAELPIEQPTTIETIVNLKTADALGIKVPDAVLVRADRVIS